MHRDIDSTYTFSAGNNAYTRIIHTYAHIDEYFLITFYYATMFYYSYHFCLCIGRSRWHRYSSNVRQALLLEADCPGDFQCLCSRE